MSIATQAFKALLVAPIVLSIAGCEEDKGAAGAATSKPPPAEPPPPPAKTAPPPPPEPNRTDCPEGSTGVGSFNKPCETTGPSRLMDVVWTGKTTDEGPQFRVTNKAKSVILYGKLVVYFYDKAGKQLELKEEGSSPPKTRPYETCAGNIFGGVMKVKEKAVLTFSCVKKNDVPEGTAKIEGEMWMVGFADSSNEKVEFYWRNSDLAPKARPLGGVK
jgi:hypothetical protein